MGAIKLRLPEFWDLEKRQASSIHVIGLDGIPWPCRVAVADRILSISRTQNESGKVHLAYPFPKHGELSVCTGTLPESESTYNLMTELARGTLNRLRNQMSIWQEGGLEVPNSVKTLVDQAVADLGASIVSSELSVKDELGRASIETAMESVFQLSIVFGQQVSAYRVSQKELTPFWLAANIGNRSFSEVEPHSVPFDLLEVGSLSCQSKAGQNIDGCEKKMVAGPLLDASAGAAVWDNEPKDNFENRKRSILGHCKQQLSELPTDTTLLHVMSGLNGIGHRQLSFPQQQQLTTELFQLVDDASVDLPMMVSFDFPWAERLAWSVGGMHPLQVADSLLRQALPISMIGLDINLDYWPLGSVVRDPLQWIDLVDIWAQLGLPLSICIRVPQGVKVVDADDTVVGSVNRIRGALSDRQRLEMLQVILPMMIARPNVSGCIFRQWSDADDPRFPGGGLVDVEGDPKEILHELERFYGSVLQRS